MIAGSGNAFADEARGQVFAQVAAPHLKERRHVLLVLGAGLERDGACVVGPTHPHHELAVPAPEQGKVLHGQAEHRHDHADRELARELLREVDLAPVGEALDQRTGHLPNDGGEGVELLPNERVANEVALGRVLGAAETQHRRPEHTVGLVAVGPGAEGLLVAEHLDEVPIPGDVPLVVQAVVVDGVVLPQAPVEGVGVFQECGGVELTRIDDGVFWVRLRS